MWKNETRALGRKMLMINKKNAQHSRLFMENMCDQVSLFSRDRIVVSTSRCGRDNPGSNPGHGKAPQGSSWLLADNFLQLKTKTRN